MFREQNDVRAFSAICAHAALTVGQDKNGGFVCSCLGVQLDQNGAVVKGLARAPLVTRVENGELLVFTEK